MTLQPGLGLRLRKAGDDLRRLVRPGGQADGIRRRGGRPVRLLRGDRRRHHRGRGLLQRYNRRHGLGLHLRGRVQVGGTIFPPSAAARALPSAMLPPRPCFARHPRLAGPSVPEASLPRPPRPHGRRSEIWARRSGHFSAATALHSRKPPRHLPPVDAVWPHHGGVRLVAEPWGDTARFRRSGSGHTPV